MLKPDEPLAIDRRLFAITFAVCALLPLAVLAAIQIESEWFGGLFVASGMVYSAAIFFVIATFARGEGGKTLPLIAGMASGAIVGPGTCFGVLGTFS